MAWVQETNVFVKMDIHPVVAALRVYFVIRQCGCLHSSACLFVCPRECACNGLAVITHPNFRAEHMYVKKLPAIKHGGCFNILGSGNKKNSDTCIGTVLSKGARSCLRVCGYRQRFFIDWNAQLRKASMKTRCFRSM